jgi:integrase
MGEPEVRAFLTHLAVERNVSAGTQNHALNALVFLYRHVLGREFELLEGVERARRSVRVPVVLSKDEVSRLLKAAPDKHRLFFQFLYGTGLRLLEALRLRIKDLDFERGQIIVHGGKGDKDRVTMLPEALRARLQEHLHRVQLLHEKRFGGGAGGGAAAGGVEVEISECGAGMDVAMVLAGGANLPRSAGRPAQAVSSARDEHPEGDAVGCKAGQADQAGHVSYVAAFVRDASFGEWL